MKSLLFLFAAFALLSLSACKKSYTCVCTTNAGIPGFSLPEQSSDLGKRTKKQAKALCDAKNTNYSFMGFTVNTVCALK